MIVYGLWDKGRRTAPALVQTVFDCWEADAGSENLRVLDGDDLDQELAETGVDTSWMNITMKSDLLRAKLVSQHGGIWADATLLPQPGAYAWLNTMSDKTGFFALTRPAKTRPLSNFLLVSKKGNPLATAFYDAFRRYLDRPRIMAKPKPKQLSFMLWRRRAKRDTRWSVDPNGGGKAPYAPYFAFHYLFDHLLATDPGFAALWADCPRQFAMHAVVTQRAQMGTSKDDFLSLAPSLLSAYRVHKLDWKRPPPEEFLDLARAAYKLAP